MAITASDLYLFASQYPVDSSVGGGLMTADVIQDGIANNAFPDVAPADRSGGRVQLRKVYMAVMDASDGTLAGAQVRIKTNPTDAGTDMVVFATGDQLTNRPAAVTYMAAAPFVKGDQIYATSTVVSGDPTKIDVAHSAPPSVGDAILCEQGSNGLLFRIVLAVTDNTTSYRITLDSTLQVGGAFAIFAAIPNPAAKAFGAAVSTGSATSGTNTIDVDRTLARVVPNLATYPTSVNLFDPANLKMTAGRVAVFRVGDTVVVEDGTNADVLRVSHVDWSGTLTFETNLGHTYSSGARVGSLLDLGDMGSKALGSFSQQAWTRVFSDAQIGNSIAANYNRSSGNIAVTNDGTITERWAIVFTSATDFKLIGENVGQVATGSTTASFAPNNPLTGHAYFTIDTAGWGSGWAVGNVLRFNTQGARAPLWMLRCVSPSSPGGDDSAILEMRGGV